MNKHSDVQAQAIAKKKSKKVLIAFIAVAVAVILILSIVLPLVLRNKGGEIFEAFVSPENSLPTEEKYALTKYDYDSLDDVQATLRADTMNVTERNLPRTQPNMLSHDFSLVYDKAAKSLKPEYGKVESNGNLLAANITFDENGYTYPGGGNLEYLKNVYAEQAYEYFGINAASASDDEKESAKTKFFNYFKYMLMTQGQHLAIEASRRSAATASDSDEINADFKTWLKKHPSADKQYGAVLGENNAVKKEITLDPLYRSYHITGLYLPAGEPVTVKVEGLAPGERIGITLGLQNSLAWRGGIPSGAENDINTLTGGIGQVKFDNAGSDLFFKKADIVTAAGKFFDYNSSSTPFLQSQWARQNGRAPWVTADFVFTENKTYTVGTAFGGAIHITMGNCYSAAKVTITGAVETPHYILGVTTPEYFDKYLRQAPGVIAVLDTENGQLIGPTGEMGTHGYMRQIKTEEVDKLAMLWHSFLSVNESFTGGPYNRFNKIMFDWHVPAGAAVALGNYSFAHPTGWFAGAMNYRGLLAGGTWGILHEIGHSHASSYGTIWGFAGGQEGEVRNNALILLSYIMFCDVGTTIRSGRGAEHGAYANPYQTVSEAIRLRGQKEDFNNNGYFEALGMYANIMHSFGAEKFYELLYTYKGVSSYASNKRADFAYRCSLIYGMNFLKYFNEHYAANITEDMFTEEQLAKIKPLPNYEAVANFYAGGIDGVKTAGDYEVAFGSPLKFDLTATTISTLDTADKKGFEIVSVSQPGHGKIVKLSDGTYEYSFNKNYTGNLDEFKFKIKLSDGIIHEFTVTLRISYNGARVSSYTVADPGTGGAAMIDNFESQLPQLTPTYYNSVIPGVPAYSSEQIEVRVADFWWRSPVSGEVSFAIGGNGGMCLYLGDDFETVERTNLIYSNGVSYGSAKVVDAKKRVEKGKYYAIRALSTNRGRGKSSANVTVGILQKDGEVSFADDMSADKIAELRAEGAAYSAIPTEQVFHVDYPLGKAANTFVYEPKFIISKKDNIKLSTTGTDKSEWTVVKAPENVLGGRYLEEEMTDETTGEVSILKTDKWTYLIDGQTGTNMHTTYGGGVPQITPENPHEFIVDTSKIQSFNYFSVTTRNNVNSYITDFELQISDTLQGEWKTIAEGDKNSYSGTTITLKFPQVNGRYLRLLVKGTTGGNFSVLAEIDAGIQSQTQRVLPSTTSLIYTTKGWKNSSKSDAEPNGYMIARKKKEKMVIRFVGESISLYAAAGQDYGRVEIKIDGKSAGIVDLNQDIHESRKLVFYKENLSNKEHTVEVITKSSGKVMLNVIGLPYNANLVNAPNIYLEHALTVSLIVFIILFVLTLTFVLLLVFLPGFRNAVFGNRLMRALDNRKSNKELKEKKPQEDNKPSKEDKKRIKEEIKATRAESAAARSSALKAQQSQHKVVGASAESRKPQEIRKPASGVASAKSASSESVRRPAARPVSHTNTASNTNRPPVRPANVAQRKPVSRDESGRNGK